MVREERVGVAPSRRGVVTLPTPAAFFGVHQPANHQPNTAARVAPLQPAAARSERRWCFVFRVSCFGSQQIMLAGELERRVVTRPSTPRQTPVCRRHRRGLACRRPRCCRAPATSIIIAAWWRRIDAVGSHGICPCPPCLARSISSSTSSAAVGRDDVRGRRAVIRQLALSSSDLGAHRHVEHSGMASLSRHAHRGFAASVGPVQVRLLASTSASP